jgi:DNA-binding IclR family transcriptional regulator
MSIIKSKYKKTSRQLATSLFKGLDVLSAVAINPEGLMNRELQHAVKLPRTSLLRILQSLELYGLVERNGRAWRVTFRFHQWTAEDPLALLRSRFRTVLEKIANEVRELVVLGAVEGGRLRHIDYVQWEHQILVHPGLARRFPLEHSAMGKLFLSQRPDLRERVSNSLLLKEIDLAGETGVGWNREETAPGIIAMASWATTPSPPAPMISVSWPSFRFNENKARSALEVIRKALLLTNTSVHEIKAAGSKFV